MLSLSKRYQQSHYVQILNRMGWSMLIFIGIFDTTTGVSSAILAMREFTASQGLYAFLTVIYGVVAALCYVAPFFLTGMIFYLLSRRVRTEGLSLEVRIPCEFPLLIFAGMLILTAAAYVNSWFCAATGYTMPPDLITGGNYDRPEVVIQYMTVAIAPAFAEEFLFRGVFYANLRPFGRTQAVLISSLLFALMHQNIGQLFYTFVAGIAMAMMYELTGSIWCSVFFHLFNNEMSIITEVLYYGKYGEACVPYLSMLDGILFLLGMISLVVLIFYYKKKNETQIEQASGIYGQSLRESGRREEPISARSVVKGLLTPGIVTFTVVTIVLMLFLWLALALMNGGFLG